MKVVLRADVVGVGLRGDIVDVPGGYARNFLLPEGKALEATEGVTAQAAAMRRSRDAAEARAREAAESHAQLLAGAVITVSARARAGGKLFGSVSANEVIEAVQAQKEVVLSRRQIALEEPIKELGSHDVPLHLHHDVVTVLTVEVVAAS